MAATTPTTATTETADLPRIGGSDGFGMGVRERRNALALSQLDLSIAAHCGVQTILRIERGGGFTQFTRRKLADTLERLEAEARAA